MIERGEVGILARVGICWVLVKSRIGCGRGEAGGKEKSRKLEKHNVSVFYTSLPYVAIGLHY